MCLRLSALQCVGVHVCFMNAMSWVIKAIEPNSIRS